MGKKVGRTDTLADLADFYDLSGSEAPTKRINIAAQRVSAAAGLALLRRLSTVGDALQVHRHSAIKIKRLVRVHRETLGREFKVSIRRLSARSDLATVTRVS